MSQKVKSALGKLVDFETLRIKQQLVGASTSTEVSARVDFVESRAKRRAIRRAEQAARKKVQADHNVAVEDETVADEVVDITDETSDDSTSRKQVRRKNVTPSETE